MFTKSITETKRYNLFKSFADSKNLIEMPINRSLEMELKTYSSIKSSWLQKQKIFSQWKSDEKPQYILVDFGTINRGGG